MFMNWPRLSMSKRRNSLLKERKSDELNLPGPIGRRDGSSQGAEHLLRIGEQRWRAACVPKHNRLTFFVHAVSNQIDQRAKSAPGIDRIENNSFATRHKADRFAFQFADDAVAFSFVT